MNLELAGLKVLVAGASRGIGEAIAEVFLENGAHVALAARSGPALERAVARLEKLHSRRVVGHACDLSVTADIVRCLEAAGPLDTLVVNYGATDCAPGFDVADADLDRLVQANLTGPVRLAREAARPMIGRGRGSILFIGSIAGAEHLGAPIGYAAGKHALGAVVRALAHELGPQGVRVNMINPGNILFEGGRWQARRESDPARVARMIDEKVPLRRFGTPRDIADMAAFLASTRAGFVTGATIDVDGGQRIAFQ